MKKLRLIVIFVLIASMLLTACAKEDNNSSSKGKDPVTPQSNVEYLDTPIIKNGLTDYKVVLPASADSFVNFAGTELTSFIYKSTGVMIDTITDEGLTYSEDAKYLSIGVTNVYKNAGFNYNLNTFGYSDYAVQTKGKSLFMVGGNHYGTLYAVYEVLERVMNFEVYADDEIYYDTLNELYLPNFKLEIQPQFDYRLGSRALTWTDGSYERRMKESSMNIVIMNTGGQNHNSFGIMPKEEYWDAHREWYSTDGEQLCYSQKDMLDEMVENLKLYILTDTSDAEIIIIGEQDVGTWCQCAQCKASKTKYGSDSAVYVQAVNYVAEKLEAWQKVELPDHRPLTYMLFAYYEPETPPLIYNTAKDDWDDPVDDSVICRDNVAIWYAPIATNYTFRFTDPENKQFYNYMKGWSKVCKNFYMWDYANNYSCYLLPSNSFNIFQDNMKFAVECGVQFYFTQATHDSRQPVFEELREYLTASLMWDCNIDYAQYIDNFFEHYYKDASVAMRKYFDGLRDHYAYIEQTYNLYGGIFTTLRKAEYWPKPITDEWMGYINEAYESIEYLKTKDSDLYEKLYNRILKESLSVRFMQIDLHGTYYDSQTLLAMKYQWKADAATVKLANIGEGNPLSSLYTTWGI